MDEKIKEDCDDICESIIDMLNKKSEIKDILTADVLIGLILSIFSIIESETEDSKEYYIDKIISTLSYGKSLPKK